VPPAEVMVEVCHAQLAKVVGCEQSVGSVKKVHTSCQDKSVGDGLEMLSQHQVAPVNWKTRGTRGDECNLWPMRYGEADAVAAHFSNDAGDPRVKSMLSLKRDGASSPQIRLTNCSSHHPDTRAGISGPEKADEDFQSFGCGFAGAESVKARIRPRGFPRNR